MASLNEQSPTAKACDEAEQALRLFLEGKFDEAEQFVHERAEMTKKIPTTMLVFIHCHAVILFARAGISGTEEDRKQAMERLQEVATLASEHIPKQGWVTSIASWGMGYFVNSSKALNIPEEEFSCRIIEAEATYMSAILCFLGESIASFLKAAFLIRKAIQGYKYCHEVLQCQEGDFIGNKHDIGAVKLGFGGFSLAISMLPPKLLRLLSVLGFPCDRKVGLSSLEKSLSLGGLRASIAGMLLASYHVILPAFFSIPQEREQHVLSAERILNLLQKMYPKNFFLSFYRGRLQRLKRDLKGSIEYFLKLDEELSLPPESKFFKLRHAWVYELGLSYMLQLQWDNAEKYWAELEEDSVWSRAFFAYMHGVCLSMSGRIKESAESFAKVEGLMRGTLSGRVLAEEQYVSRKVKDHALDSEDGVKSLQGCLSGVEFLYLWNSFPQMPQEKLEDLIKIIEEAEALWINQPGLAENAPDFAQENSTQQSHQNQLAETDEGFFSSVTPDYGYEAEDDLALCKLMKGTALRELGRLDAAQDCLDGLRDNRCYVETELFIYPMAAYERALLLINRHIDLLSKEPEQASSFHFLKEANKELSIAEGFKEDYNFLWRLLGRVHAARAAIQGLMGEEDKAKHGSANVKEDGTVEGGWDEKFEGAIMEGFDEADQSNALCMESKS